MRKKRQALFQTLYGEKKGYDVSEKKISIFFPAAGIPDGKRRGVSAQGMHVRRDFFEKYIETE